MDRNNTPTLPKADDIYAKISEQTGLTKEKIKHAIFVHSYSGNFSTETLFNITQEKADEVYNLYKKLCNSETEEIEETKD